jgi:hypothetical protein
MPYYSLLFIHGKEMMRIPFKYMQREKEMMRSVVLFSVAVAFVVMCSSTGFSLDSVLQAGVAKTDITPTESLYMGGYDSNMRDVPSDGTYGNIFLRAIVFDDMVTKVVFIVSDIVGYRGYEEIRRSVSDETGIPYGNIILCSTHNHAAPVIGGMNEDSEWSRTFTQKTIDTVRNAIKDCEPVKIGGGIGHSSIAMNRRKKMEDTLSYISFDENNSSQSAGKFKTADPVMIPEIAGLFRLGANPGGPIDDEVGILRIDTLDGTPKAVLVNYACHGTSLGGRNHTISPEWMGHMVEYVENTVPGITGLYLQGAAGDINPRFCGGIDGTVDSLERTAQLGYEIGEEVVRVFGGIATDNALNSQIRHVHKDIVCPLKYNRVMSDFKTTTVPVPTTAIKIDEFTWVTFPGELFHEIGKQIKASTHNRYSFLVGYCNGGLGYMVTQHAFSEGGYEPNSSRFAPVTEKVYLNEVRKLLIGLN